MLRRLGKLTVKPALAALGYEIRLADRSTADGRYGSIRTSATYTPWNVDTEFQRVFALAHDKTLADVFRCYELWSLVGQVAHLPGACLEVGVWNGGTASVIARRAQLTRPGAPVYLCDTFTGVVKADVEDPHYKGGEHHDASKATVERLLERVGATATILEGIFPDQTAARIPEQPFCFCHVDVDVYRSARETTEWVWPKMPVGGVVVYDDYGFFGCDGVRSYVDTLVGLPDRAVVYNLNGHAIVVKTA
jgi:O-methyltransferase